MQPNHHNTVKFISSPSPSVGITSPNLRSRLNRSPELRKASPLVIPVSLHDTLPPDPQPIPTAKDLFRNPKNDTKKKIIVIVITLFADVVLPVALFFILKIWIAAVWALLAAGGPALISVIVKLIWKREVDVIGVLVFCAFAVSAVIAIVTQNGRILVFEKSIVTAILGVVFLISLIPFPLCWKSKSNEAKELQYQKDYGRQMSHTVRPFLFYTAQQLLPLGTMELQGGVQDKLEWLWIEIPQFRWSVGFITGLWGFGLLIEFAGRLIMVLSALSLTQVVLYANIFFAGVLIVLLLLSVWYAAHARRKVFAEVDAWIALHYMELTVPAAALPSYCTEADATTKHKSPVQVRQ